MTHFVERAVVRAEVSCANVGSKRINVGFRGIHLVRDIHVFGAVHQVCNVASPAAHIGTRLNNCIRHSLRLGVVGHVHSAEYVTEVRLIAVGQYKVLDVFQRGSRSAVLGILLGNIGGEGGIFLAADHFPGAGGIALHAGADVVDDQRIDISAIFCRIGLGIAFQNLEAGKESIVIRNLRDNNSIFRSFQFQLVHHFQSIRLFRNLCFLRNVRLFRDARLFCGIRRFRRLAAIRVNTRNGTLGYRVICRICADRQQRCQQHGDNKAH